MSTKLKVLSVRSDALAKKQQSLHNELSDVNNEKARVDLEIYWDLQQQLSDGRVLFDSLFSLAQMVMQWANPRNSWSFEIVSKCIEGGKYDLVIKAFDRSDDMNRMRVTNFVLFPFHCNEKGMVGKNAETATLDIRSCQLAEVAALFDLSPLERGVGHRSRNVWLADVSNYV